MIPANRKQANWILLSAIVNMLAAVLLGVALDPSGTGRTVLILLFAVGVMELFVAVFWHVAHPTRRNHA